MSFAYPGITHCKKCGKALDINEHYYCNKCDEEIEIEKQKEKELKNQIEDDAVDIMEEFSNVMAESRTITNIENLKFDSVFLNVVPHKPTGISYDEWYANIGFNIISMYNRGQQNIKVQFIEKEEIGDKNNE